MTSLLAACRKDFAATLGLHARTKSVRFGAAAFPRLKCTLWQSTPPCFGKRPAKFPSAIPCQQFAVGSNDQTRWPRGSSVKPYCRNPGSFLNSLVYLRGAHRVKKRAGVW